MRPLTQDELKEWKGWSLLESDPVRLLSDPDALPKSSRAYAKVMAIQTLFNFMLREYGIRDVKVYEIISLMDDAVLASLPYWSPLYPSLTLADNVEREPIHGLIFLSKYQTDEPDEKDESTNSPNHVWFANQTTKNACATIALLNIIMNAQGIDLGDALSKFKESTSELRPAYRGRQLSSNEFIRNIHNSFSR